MFSIGAILSLGTLGANGKKRDFFPNFTQSLSHSSDDVRREGAISLHPENGGLGMLQISNIQSGSMPTTPMSWKPQEEIGNNKANPNDTVPKTEIALDKKQKEEAKEKVNLEDLLMKPTPLPLEERLNQVISPEEVKDLLSLITRAPLAEKAESHVLDTKR